MNVDDALPGFIVESTDLLREMEAGLLDGDAADAETVNLIFRCAHTIKGSAGLFGLDSIVRFVHVLETVLDLVRQRRLAMSESLRALLLAGKDHIAQLVARVEAGERLSAPDTRGDELASELRRAAGLEEAAAGNGAAEGHEPQAQPDSRPGGSGESLVVQAWRVSARFSAEVLKAGMDPLAFVRYLSTFATLDSVRIVADGLPAPEEFDPESCYLGMEIALRTAAARERIEAAFDFVREDCTLQITPIAATSGSATSAGEETAKSEHAGNESGKRGAAARSIRVDAEKLDHLITRIGELIIAAAGTQLAARRAEDAGLEEHASMLTGLVEQVRESALQLRMVKIGGVFDRFKRVVHDLSRELGKEIGLIVRGEDTELDKTLVERIADPLTHLVRNAMDHGIEPAGVRAQRGKPPAGTVTLNAFHDSGSIVIEVSDDGGGLRREKILAKALERGLVDAARELSDGEVFNLIFEPGFSTAERVTNMSGRGVGMDVVKRNITALRGTIGLRSEEGVGTTVSIRLPLTLAIINGFQVGVGGSSYVLPLEAIDECVELTADTGHDFTDLRGEVLPFVRLREVFGTSQPAARRESIVVVRHGGQRAGLVVDALLGESQTVIKPLGKIFRNVACVTGSSILGNGEVALILDVPALVRQAAGRNSSSSVILRRG